MKKSEILLTILALVGFSVSVCAQSKIYKKAIIIEAVVEKIAPPVPPSGVLASFRLVKYKVLKVCKGKYGGETIIVDHFITSDNLLNEIDVGSKVYIPILESSTIDRRLNADGIRSSKDIVERYFLATRVFPVKEANCTYIERDILFPKK